MKRRGFTLIELLTVMLIIGVLMGLVIFTLTAALRHRRTTATKLYLQELQTAIQAYATKYDGILPIFVAPNASNPPPYDNAAQFYNLNQNSVMVDNLSNINHSWVQSGGDMLGKHNPHYKFKGSPEALEDAWGNSIRLKVVNTSAVPAPPDQVVVKIGRKTLLLYSAGRNSDDTTQDLDEHPFKEFIGPSGLVP